VANGLRGVINWAYLHWVKGISMVNLIWTAIVILFVLWFLGLILKIGGSLVHILIVVAAVLVIYNFISRGRATL
jgi:hypothetical protein